MLPRFAMFQKVPIEIAVPGNAGIKRYCSITSQQLQMLSIVTFQKWYFCWSGHVSSSLISNVSKVTSLWYLVCICGSWRIAWVISHTLSVQLTRDPADKSPGNAGIEKDQVQFCLFFHLFYIEAHVVNGLGRKLRFILICLKDFLAT